MAEEAKLSDKRIFVRGIFSSAVAREKFGPFGDIDHVKRTSKCLFVEMKDADAASEAVAQLHGTEVNGRSLVVEFAREMTEKQAKPRAANTKPEQTGEKSTTRLYVKGSEGKTIRKETISDTFGKFGTVANIRVISRYSCSFVEFEDADSAAKAMEALNNTEVDGQNLTVEYSSVMAPPAEPKGKKSAPNRRRKPARRARRDPEDRKTAERSTTRLYVKGSNKEPLDEEGLKGLFANHGSIVDIKSIPFSKCSFIEMGSEEECAAAIAAYNGSEFGGQTLTVEHATVLRQPKGDEDNTEE